MKKTAGLLVAGIMVAAGTIATTPSSSASVRDALPTHAQIAKIFKTQPLHESRSKDDRLYLCWDHDFSMFGGRGTYWGLSSAKATQVTYTLTEELNRQWYNPIVQPHETVSSRINRRFSGAAPRIKEAFSKGGGPYDIAACKTATKDNIEVRVKKLKGKKRFGKQARQVSVIYRRDKLGSEWGQWASTSIISAVGRKKFVVTRYYTDRPRVELTKTDEKRVKRVHRQTVRSL